MTQTHRLLTLVATAILSLSSIAHAQRGDQVNAENPKFETLQSPDIRVGGTNKKTKPKDWLEIEVKLKADNIKSKEAKKEGFLDSLTVEWYVVAKGQNRKTYMMEKTVEYVNVPINEDVYVSVYLSPTTLKRLTGNDSARKSDLEAIGGEILLDGRMVGKFSHGQKAGWWRKELGSVTRSQKFPLLNKNETPFKFLWWDRYAEIKSEK